MSPITTTYKGTKFVIPCDEDCMFAAGDECNCACEGRNHQAGNLLTQAQRKVVRTKAGRRVTPFTPNTADWKWAREMYQQHEAGITKKDIARWHGVSQPTVRRFITRYLLTEALLAKQAKAAAKKGKVAA
jgi:hypothetical protein